MKNLLLMLVAMSALTMSALAMAAVNVNTADAEALSELPYIGEAKSAAIIEEREAHGDFESVDDLTRVSGIGSATVARKLTPTSAAVTPTAGRLRATQ